MVPTGLRAVDALLGGGIPGGIVADVFGGTGTGKTQLLMQLAAASVRGGGRVLYIDAAGTFRPERVVEIQGAHGAGPGLDSITVSRVRSVSEQEGSLGRAAGFSLVGVDSVTDLFGYEYPGKEAAHERNSLLMRHMRALSGLAASGGIPVVVTNTVRSIDGAESESMRRAVDPYTHVKIRLSRAGGLRGRAYWALGGADFEYRIGAAGLRDAQDI